MIWEKTEIYPVFSMLYKFVTKELLAIVKEMILSTKFASMPFQNVKQHLQIHHSIHLIHLWLFTSDEDIVCISFDAGTGEAGTTCHVLSLLKDNLVTFPKNHLKTTCETILKVMTLSNVVSYQIHTWTVTFIW